MAMKFSSSNFESIYNFLTYRQGRFCDDCISLLTDVSPRQQVNQICNLRHRNLIHTGYGRCSHCGKTKIVRSSENCTFGTEGGM